eukprot:scaffold60756_cov35-Tisochrysis_lutea.AAC.4
MTSTIRPFHPDGPTAWNSTPLRCISLTSRRVSDGNSCVRSSWLSFSRYAQTPAAKVAVRTRPDSTWRISVESGTSAAIARPCFRRAWMSAAHMPAPIVAALTRRVVIAERGSAMKAWRWWRSQSSRSRSLRSSSIMPVESRGRQRGRGRGERGQRVGGRHRRRERGRREQERRQQWKGRVKEEKGRQRKGNEEKGWYY